MGNHLNEHTWLKMANRKKETIKQIYVMRKFMKQSTHAYTYTLDNTIQALTDELKQQKGQGLHAGMILDEERLQESIQKYVYSFINI